MWCDFDGECVRVNTMRGFAKERNMRRDPRVTLLCFNPRQPLRYLEVRGTVAQMTEDGADRHLDGLASKYAGRPIRYFGGLWLLSWIGPASAVVPDVMVGVGVMALGISTFTAPLAAVTMGSLDEADQGLASGVNNAICQLAGLLAIVVLPAVAGLAGVTFGDPAFAAGYGSALRAAACLAGVGVVVAALTLGGTRSGLRPPSAERTFYSH